MPSDFSLFDIMDPFSVARYEEHAILAVLGVNSVQVLDVLLESLPLR